MKKFLLLLNFVDQFILFYIILYFYYQVASHTLDYSFSSAEPREKDSFGLDTGGRVMLVPANRFQELVASLNEAYTVPS